MSEHKLTPEDKAKQDFDALTISAVDSIWVISLFLMAMALPPVLDFAIQVVEGEKQYRETEVIKSIIPEAGEWRHIASVADAKSVLPSVKDIEQAENLLVKNTILRDALLPPAQLMLTRYGNVGNESALLGNKGWLYYRDDLAYLKSDNGKNIEKAISTVVDFRNQLEMAGIKLVVLPTPVKPEIYPEKYSFRFSPDDAPLTNTAYEQFMSQLMAEEIHVFRTKELLNDFKKQGDSYLRMDTHWSFDGMHMVSDHLAEFIESKGWLNLSKGVFKADSTTVSNYGDIYRMLNLPETQRVFDQQQVDIMKISAESSVEEKPVMLLGDSFSNIFSLDALGWGEDAGLAEQMSYQLQLPVEKIAINAGGAYTSRSTLQKKLRKDSLFLKDTKVVIWQFASRELTQGNWEPLEFNIGQIAKSANDVEETTNDTIVDSTNTILAQSKPDLKPEKPQAQEDTVAKTSRPASDSEEVSSKGTILRGTVKRCSEPPQPGSVPYENCIIALRLTDVMHKNNDALDNDILVYVWGMQKNEHTRWSRLKSGDEIEIRTQEWLKVEGQFGSFNRKEIDDTDSFLLDAYWATEFEKK